MALGLDQVEDQDLVEDRDQVEGQDLVEDLDLVLVLGHPSYGDIIFFVIQMRQNLHGHEQFQSEFRPIEKLYHLHLLL